MVVQGSAPAGQCRAATVNTATVHPRNSPRRGRIVLLGLLLCGALVSCAAHPPTEFAGWFKDFSSCRDEYAAMDARVAAAGVGDAAYYRVAGFPYLRSDRLLASFRNEVQGVNQVGGWIRRMREFDQEAREYEYINLGMTTREAAIQRFRFLNCGRALAGMELDDPAGMSRLLAAVQPPDEYSTLARAIGLYPLAIPLMQAELTAQQDAELRELAQPLSDLKSSAPLRLWSVKPVENLDLVNNAYAHAVPDELGLPGLVDSEWRALAEYYAPLLWIETSDQSDYPAAPRLTATGADADTQQPLVNYQVNFTRFGGQALTQISYFIWFKGARTDGSSALDGLIWRVTLDARGRPLLYESLHESGRDHRWFPVQPMTRRADSGYWHEPQLVDPQAAPARFATLRLASGSHLLRHVTGPQQAEAEQQAQYELRPYENLFTLPNPAGGTRSLFGPDGLVRESRGPDPSWWFSSGLRQPGALRQYGHHAIAHIGRSHFDDPFLLESVFTPDAPGTSPLILSLDEP